MAGGESSTATRILFIVCPAAVGELGSQCGFAVAFVEVQIELVELVLEAWSEALFDGPAASTGAGQLGLETAQGDRRGGVLGAGDEGCSIGGGGRYESGGRDQGRYRSGGACDLAGVGDAHGGLPGDGDHRGLWVSSADGGEFGAGPESAGPQEPGGRVRAVVVPLLFGAPGVTFESGPFTLQGLFFVVQEFGGVTGAVEGGA
jgi:hypothetical protein